eukprot:scaffold22680_cov107-Cylindrotheca_fusiformis.AAC.23
MPPRRRNKSTSARSAAIQAVRRRQGGEDPSSASSFHHNHYHQHYPSGKQNNHHNAREDEYDNDSDVPALLDHDPDDMVDLGSDHKDEDGASEDEDGCLHCHVVSTDIQVHCDECQSYICQTCHWCHEFQANHEIRVCDRCDAFYCRHCDEMDQCDDCGEVVCASCSTLLSCKFCGGGLCEECATACGRCGIVLCSRDAKFAVDCDTCRLSYCLVCLASGSKDPCVRCGHRPSKRMEQLVHLRLKSIYKAFKQSSSSTNKGQHGKNTTTIEELEDDDDDEVPDLDVDNSILLAAAAAKKHTTGYYTSRGDAGSSPKRFTPDMLAERYVQEKQKADAAAEALLAELDEEEEAKEAAKSKKSKKKRKKERQMAAKREEDEKRRREEEEARNAAAKSNKEKVNSGEIPKKGRKSPKPAASVEDNTVSSKSEIEPPKSAPEVLEESIPVVDDIETRLVQVVDSEDIEGIEALLFELKGVPGRAALRKNAKKALKRLRCSRNPVSEEQDVAEHFEKSNVNYKNDCVPHRSKEGIEPMHVPTTSTGELLKVVSDSTTAKSNRAECVMQMSPSVVGWVIGKGGQRIRDLMEESGAKVWIDQEKAKPQECRSVYVSGERNSVDLAVQMVKDIVAKAPIGQQLQHQQELQQKIGNGDAAAKKEEPSNPPSNVAAVPIAEKSSSAEVPRTDTNFKTQNTPKPAVAQGGDHRAETEEVPESNPSLINEIANPIKAPAPLSSSLPVSKDQPGFAQHVLTCEARFVPLLIGKRGWTIKNIQDESGARVDIDQTVTPRQIKISGSSSNVETAIGMVRDVLSYPHAQLQQQQNTSTLLGDTREEGAHSPPPSLAIVTGDAKSMISASSSLSSTPEPSMASTTKSHHLPPGPFVPPEFGGGVNHMQGAAPNVYMSMAQGPGNPNHQPHGYGSGPPFLMGMQQQHPAGMSLPVHQQPQHPSMYSPGPPLGVKDPPMNAAFSAPLQNQPPAPLGFALGVGGRGTDPAMQQSFMQIPAGSTNHQMNHYKPTEAGLDAPLQEGDVAANAPHGLWNPNPGYPDGGLQPKPPVGYYDGRGGDSVPLFDRGSGPSGQPQAPFPSLRNPKGTAAAPLGSGRDDSLMVDSLFAPIENAKSAPEESNLLLGLNGLAIGNDAIGGGSKSGGGLWGPASLSPWETEKQSAETAASYDAVESTLLSGLEPLHTQAHESTHQHPAQSRFNWNAMNI